MKDISESDTVILHVLPHLEQKKKCCCAMLHIDSKKFVVAQKNCKVGERNIWSNHHNQGSQMANQFCCLTWNSTTWSTGIVTGHLQVHNSIYLMVEQHMCCYAQRYVFSAKCTLIYVLFSKILLIKVLRSHLHPIRHVTLFYHLLLQVTQIWIDFDSNYLLYWAKMICLWKKVIN